MTLATDHPEVDIRLGILLTAERLFREIGYQKTTVADIAKALKMSPANVYRFFESKKAIHEGVARRLMGEVEQATQEIARREKPASERLRALLKTVHQMNAERYVDDSKMHEMVAVAMEQSWDVCHAHIDTINCEFAKVIADGMAEGEFRQADPQQTALCVCASMTRYFHPQLIAESADLPGPTIDQMIDFVLAALREGRN